MNIKERAMAAYHGEAPDRIPWLIYDMLFPRGYMERQLRNMGLGLKVPICLWKEEMPNVRLETKTDGNIVTKTYHTPLGDATRKERIGLREGAGSFWVVEHLIKDVADFEIIEFMTEDTVYTPDYERFYEAQRNLGDDGLVFVWAGRSPIQEMQVELMGCETFAKALYKHPKEFESLRRALEKRTDERYRIIAGSPVEIVNGTDNISSETVSPKLFEKYVIPFYKKQFQLLSKKGKILEDHMDGKLKCLKDLIAKTDLHVVEAVTPPPMGDLFLAEARAAWNGKAISTNFPESVFLEGPEAVKKETLKILSDVAPGDRFIFTVTEDILAEQRWNGLLGMAEVMEKHASYPLHRDDLPSPY